ncbi:MAG: hypothetical protein HY869_21015 [Chloroflexi bacterium]|nr:hypothetical protein [Chloroflexota bacterium]
MKHSSPVRTFRLSDLLREMVEEADHRPRQPIQRRLKHGLIITITWEAPMYQLVLKRADTMPSFTEWDVVRKAWPWATSVQAIESQIARPPFLYGRVGPRPMV